MVADLSGQIWGKPPLSQFMLQIEMELMGFGRCSETSCCHFPALLRHKL